jgi:hypothetical protein
MVKIINGDVCSDFTSKDTNIMIVFNSFDWQPGYIRFTQFRNATIHVRSTINVQGVEKEVLPDRIIITVINQTYTLKEREFKEFELISNAGTTVVSGSKHDMTNDIKHIKYMSLAIMLLLIPTWFR